MPATPTKVESCAASPPAWILAPPAEDEAFLYFAGHRSEAATIEDGLNDAAAEAARQVVELLDIKA